MLALCYAHTHPWPLHPALDPKYEEHMLKEGHLHINAENVTALTASGQKLFDAYMKSMKDKTGLGVNQMTALNDVHSGCDLPKDWWGLNEKRVLVSLYPLGLIEGDYKNQFILSKKGKDYLIQLDREKAAAEVAEEEAATPRWVKGPEPEDRNPPKLATRVKKIHKSNPVPPPDKAVQDIQQLEDDKFLTHCSEEDTFIAYCKSCDDPILAQFGKAVAEYKQLRAAGHKDIILTKEIEFEYSMVFVERQKLTVR